MAGNQTKNKGNSSKPSHPRFSLKALLWFVTASCVLLALSAAILPRLLGPSTWRFLLIVAFASYPFAAGITAEYICKWANGNLYARRIAITSGLAGVIPAILLNYPKPLVYMVAPIAGIVLVLCFAATGGLIGSILDFRNRTDPNR